MVWYRAITGYNSICCSDFSEQRNYHHKPAGGYVTGLDDKARDESQFQYYTHAPSKAVLNEMKSQ